MVKCPKTKDGISKKNKKREEKIEKKNQGRNEEKVKRDRRNEEITKEERDLDPGVTAPNTLIS